MSDLDEYHQNLMADIRREADASGIMMVEAFFDRMTERLTEAGELEVADRAYYQSGEGGQKLRIDGYAGDPRDSEGVLGLIICDFVDSDEVQTFAKGDVPPILNPLQSAACCLHISNTIRKTLFQDLLYKTTSIVQEGEQRDKENPTPVKHSS